MTLIYFPFIYVLMAFFLLFGVYSFNLVRLIEKDKTFCPFQVVHGLNGG
ncbi:MAG: hypothetical protein OEY59_04970 [Deltaproteobacteria bacterium]|nr:hypothetical protein [Deltaproteobacteria bacterium]